ncbi:DUF6702 family protein [Nonlabens marinus]|uniref:Uncharacterized protein n=1 Tax=Nonlabens marinus S1-08 TaxID=1454201 RepID=W8VX09_9FLAO|nr:DUF6702 family protein [Nonlabens marinus]BAO55187.1 hypothetical protein NMS_1178 [Nonlabens marinus S1-08]
MKKILYPIVLLMGISTLAHTVPKESVSIEPFRFHESEINQFHKYYLSVSNVSYSSKAKALQMVSRYFIDDLEDVLNERLDKKLTLGNADELEELKPVLDRYFSKRMVVSIDGKATTPKILGAEYDADQIKIYIEIPAATSPKTVELSNKALFELFPEQKNLTHFKIKEERKSILNSADTPVDRAKF